MDEFDFNPFHPSQPTTSSTTSSSSSSQKQRTDHPRSSNNLSNDDEFHFPGVDNHQQRDNVSSTNKSIRSSSSSILRRGRGGKTKAARKKFAQAQKLQEIDKSVRWQEDEDTTISTKNSTKSRRRRRRRPKEILTPEEDTTSLISSQTSSNAVAIVEEDISREQHYSQNDDGDSVLSSNNPANLGDEQESLSSSSSRKRQNCHNSSSARSSLSSLSTNDDSYCSSLHQNNNNSRSSDISANTTTSLDKKRSSSTSFLRRQKRRQGNSSSRESLSSQSTLVRNDDDDDEYFSSSPSHNSSDPTTAVKGAGANVFAVQDAGSYHMLRDDCLYLCSSGKEESLWELAWLLSEKKNRFLLWTHDISSNTQQTTTSPTKKQPHQSMHVCNAILQLFSDYYNHTTKSNDDGDDDDGSCHSSRSINHNDDDSSSITSSVASVSSSTKKPPDPTQRGRRSRCQTNESRSLYNHNAVAALSTILCFLSWDCTTTNSISACEHDRKFMARQIRATILQHSKAFCGMVQLLLLLQPEQPSDNQTRQQDLIIASQPKGTEEEDQNQDNQSNEEPSKVKFIDPTSLGRRRRKRKRGNQQKCTSTVRLLSPVIEDKATCTNNDEIHPPDNSKAIFHFQSASSCEEEKELTCDRKKNTTAITDSTPLQNNTTANISAVARKVCQKIPRLSWKDKQAGVETIEEEGESIPNCFRWITLESIARIIQGKASDEQASSSCYVLEEEEEGEHDDNDDKDSTHSPTNETAMNHSYSTNQNPLLVTNQWLYQSGALTILSTAMSQALQFSQDHRMISTLATLLDGACLFSNGNRQELCETGELIPSLLRCLVQLLLPPQKNNRSEAGDTEKKDTSSDKTTPTTTISLEIILLCLRTLTSLTHENDLAGQQLQLEIIIDGVTEEEQPKKLSGSDILLQFLYQMVQWTNHDDDTDQPSTAAASDDTYPSMATPMNNTNQQQHPLQYDCIVFCLNTLTNIVESANLFEIISTYRVPDGDNSFYLAWLTQWIIGETASFRNLLLEGKKSIKGGSNTPIIDDEGLSFSKDKKDDEKEEEINHKNHSAAGQKDEEDLVTSGNGFIFLACLMTTASSWTCKRQKEQTSRLILDDLKPHGGYDLMMNTLRSFCNLYYYSLGSDLSMAVVAPVKELLEKLSVLRKKEWA